MPVLQLYPFWVIKGKLTGGGGPKLPPPPPSLPPTHKHTPSVDIIQNIERTAYLSLSLSPLCLKIRSPYDIKTTGMVRLRNAVKLVKVLTIFIPVSFWEYNYSYRLKKLCKLSYKSETLMLISDFLLLVLENVCAFTLIMRSKFN